MCRVCTFPVRTRCARPWRRVRGEDEGERYPGVRAPPGSRGVTAAHASRGLGDGAWHHSAHRLDARVDGRHRVQPHGLCDGVVEVVAHVAHRRMRCMQPVQSERRRVLSSLAAKLDRTQEVDAYWQAGAAALRRATACSGGGVAATTRVRGTGGRYFKYRPPPGSLYAVGSSTCGPDRARSAQAGARSSWLVVRQARCWRPDGDGGGTAGVLGLGGE